jgi:transcriptional regulator with XRE-family HTH domain
MLRVRNASDEREPRIGERLREIRRRDSLTLQVVADKSGVAASTISKIENRQISASYDTLKKICDGLSISLEDLVNPAHRVFTSGRRAVTRLGEPIRFESGQYDYQVHASELSRKSMVPFEMTVRARKPDEFDHWSRHDGEEFVYVMNGAIMVHTEIYAPFRLSKGESAYFDSGMGHIYVSVSKEDAQILSICYDPQSGRGDVQEFMSMTTQQADAK